MTVVSTRRTLTRWLLYIGTDIGRGIAISDYSPSIWRRSSSSSFFESAYLVCASYKIEDSNEQAFIHAARGRLDGTYLALLLPQIAFLFDALDLSLKVLCLDIDLPQPIERVAMLSISV